MTTATHDATVLEQYDSRAQAYLASAVHASGADLERMAAVIGSRPHAVALDMGCGGGHVAFRMAGLVGKVVAYDLSAAMLETVAAEARKRGLDNIVTKRGAAEALPCPSGSFDVVATRYSAHHWGAFTDGLAQMRRVVKPDGLALFMDVVSPGVPLLDTWLQSLELLRDPSHVRNGTLAEWKAALASLGFAVGEVATYKLRLDFGAWIERMQTPDVHVAAIRSLQRRASAEVKDYFALEDDGSFTIDSALIVARPV
ncbi:class I SAM-dependent methyltransferase [Massilia sp. Root335]|uniref:class I SAM-dependent methyltransferase n=1 Tax=Massilia sp. Root335 TaxID=1736517 RepID=UPI0006F6C607|nr:class I SAM-dependent methyltransferase [Massilia sp. Root335]KQV49662.1 SAM-dependent methyltransferase [Massilia sp. Root335]